MPVADFRIYRYRLPLTAPLLLAGERVSTREGALIRLESEAGAVGWGDVAPLPGFSDETLSDAVAHLEALEPILIGQRVPDDLVQMDRPWGEAPASVCFGIELALAHLMAKVQNVRLPGVIVANPRSTVSLNALLSGSPDEVMQAAERVSAAGYRAAKLKLGRSDLPTEVHLVRALLDRFGEKLTLRLDANRAWTLSEAQQFFQRVDPAAIDYVEEPLADPSELPLLADDGVPVALDETMRAIDALDQHRYARAVVLKPSLVGGLVRALHLARRATELGLTPVISAAYESGIGLRGLVALAASLGDPDVPAGLDTYRRLCVDVVAPRFPLEGPVLDVAPLMDVPTRLNADTVERANQPITDR